MNWRKKEFVRKKLSKLSFDYKKDRTEKEINLLYVAVQSNRWRLGNNVLKQKFSKSKSRTAWKKALKNQDYDKIPLIYGEVHEDDRWNYD